MLICIVTHYLCDFVQILQLVTDCTPSVIPNFYEVHKLLFSNAFIQKFLWCEISYVLASQIKLLAMSIFGSVVVCHCDCMMNISCYITCNLAYKMKLEFSLSRRADKS